MPTLRHVDPTRPPGLLARLLSRVATTRPGRFVARGVGWKLDPLLLRLTGGRVSTTVVLPTAVLETVGARTGRPRRNALIYFHDGDRVVLVASNAGAAHHPAWYHNVVAHPDVELGGIPMRARVVTDEVERARLWSLAEQVFPGYAVYRRDAEQSGRSIPLLTLTRV